MNEYAEAYFEECMALKRELKEQRNVTIEECARVVENHKPWAMQVFVAEIAAAIRALKDKP